MTSTLIRAAMVGTEVGPIVQEIDARWLMAYAAGLGERDARYYDTEAPGGPVAHPLFAVCYEWPVALAIRAKTIDGGVAARSVHATHHLVIHRAPRAGDRLATVARVVEVARRRSGTRVTTRFTTTDVAGAPVTTTEYGSIYRDVDCDAESSERAAESSERAAESSERAAESSEGAAESSEGAAESSERAVVPERPSTTGLVRWRERVDVTAPAAHVYTECARIWNPIHTDVAAARAAGLPAIILHGTATLGLAVSRVVARDVAGDPTRVREIAGRFRGMVCLPSTVETRGGERSVAAVRFEAVDAAGAPVVSDGLLGLSETPDGGR